MNKFSQASAIVIDGGGFPQGKRAATPSPPQLLQEPRGQAKSCSRATILLRLAPAPARSPSSIPIRSSPSLYPGPDVQGLPPDISPSSRKSLRVGVSYNQNLFLSIGSPSVLARTHQGIVFDNQANLIARQNWPWPTVG